jgi:DNA-binding transcriptional ArsR family regulator
MDDVSPLSSIVETRIEGRISGLKRRHKRDRLELLDLLVQAPRSVEQLAEASAMSVANTSQHLQRLKRAGLVTSERRGTTMRYRIANSAVARLWVELRTVAEQQLAEMDRALDAYRTQRHDYVRVQPDALLQELETGTAVLLDVRPSLEFAAGHLLARCPSHSTSCRSASMSCRPTP